MINIRSAKSNDISRIHELECACFPDPWSLKSLRATMNEERSFFAVAEDNERLFGYLNATWVLDEMELNRVCVLPEFRYKGVGGALIEAMLQKAKEEKLARIYLEVRVSNLPAQRLYERYSFQTVGERRNFYTAPVENGRIMMAVITENAKNCNETKNDGKV